MKTDLAIVAKGIKKRFPDSKISILQFSDSQKLNIEIGRRFFVLETDSLEDGIGFAQVQTNTLDFDGYEIVIPHGMYDQVANRAAALIAQSLELPAEKWQSKRPKVTSAV